MTNANWNTRFNVQKQHIVWRETFYEVKFNVLQKAYAHLRMAFVNKDTIIGANCTLADHVNKYGTSTKFAEAIGDTAFDAKKGLNATAALKATALWVLRAPFVVIGLTAAVITAGCEVVLRKLA